MSAAEKIVRQTIEKMDESDKTLVLVWAEKAQEISDRNDLSTVEKVRLLHSLETTPAVKSVIFALSAVFKQHLWDERSWPARGTLSGLALGAAVAGSQGARDRGDGWSYRYSTFLGHCVGWRAARNCDR